MDGTRKRELEKGTEKSKQAEKRRTETDVTLFLVNKAAKLWVSPDIDARCYQGSSGTIPTTSKKNAIVCQVRHHSDNNPSSRAVFCLGTSQAYRYM